MRASRLVTIVMLMFVFAVFVPTARSQTAAPAAQPQPCADAKQKQLDFWVGNWDLTWPGQKQGEIAHGSNTHQAHHGRLRGPGKFLRRRSCPCVE